MEEMKETLGQIEVVVELAPFLKHFADPKRGENQAFKKYLLQQLNDLVEDLGIPVEISLDVRLGKVNNDFSMNSYKVSINDRKCRLPLGSTITSPDVKTPKLSRSVAGAIHKNRELFVTVQLTEKIWDIWLAETGEACLHEFSLEGFHEFLLSLVRRGFRIDRGKEVTQSFIKKEESEKSVEKCFEKAVSGFDTTAIRLFFNDEVAKIHSSADDEPIEEMFDLMQDGFFYELGVILPKVSIDTDKSLEENEFRIQLNDLRFPPISSLEPDQFLVNATSERLSELNIASKKAVNPASGSECSIVQYREETLEMCRNEGLTTWGPSGFIILNLSGEVRRTAELFLTAETVKYSMYLLKEAFPDLAESASRRFDIFTLTRILRDLLDEEISIRDYRGILESLLAVNGTTDVDQSKYIVFFPNTGNLCPVAEWKKVEDLNIGEYSSWVRMHFKRYISHKYTRGSYALVVYLMDPEIESRIMNIDKQPFKDEEYDRLMKAIFDEVGNLPPTSSNPVILTTLEVRKKLRNLIEKEFPQIAVLCYQELSPELNIQPIARISWG